MVKRSFLPESANSCDNDVNSEKTCKYKHTSHGKCKSDFHCRSSHETKPRAQTCKTCCTEIPACKQLTCDRPEKRTGNKSRQSEKKSDDTSCCRAEKTVPAGTETPGTHNSGYRIEQVSHNTKQRKRRYGAPSDIDEPLRPGCRYETGKNQHDTRQGRHDKTCKTGNDEQC